jgi:hypothetical protein
MKYILTFIFCLIITTSVSFAQESDKSIDTAMSTYLTNLNSTSPGVVENTIENVMVLKLYYPNKDYSSFIQKLDEINLSDHPNTIRVKALIAANYLRNPQFDTDNLIKYPWQYKMIKMNNPEVPIEKLVSEEHIKQLLNSVESIWQEK